MLRQLIRSKVFRNFSYLTIGSIFAQALGLVTILKITRLFSPAEYGLFTFIMAQGMLLLAIGDLGIRDIIIRSIARDKSRTNDLVVNGVILRTGAVILLIIIYIAYNKLFGSLSKLEIVLLFLFTLVSSMASLFENIFLGYEKMLPISLLNLTYSIAWFFSVLVIGNITVIFLFGIFLTLNSLKVAGQYFILHNQNYLVGPVKNFWASTKALLKESWPYFSLVCVMLPVNHFSNNFLDLNSSLDEIGYYNLSQKLLGPVSMVIGFGLSAVFPNLSALWAKDQTKFASVISEGLRYFLLSSLVLCALFTLFAREVVLLLFTEDYLPAVEVCQLQVWFIFLMGINSLIGTILGATNNEKLLFKFGIINALISTPMLFLGSYYGALGLSYGYVISFALFEVYLWIVFKKVLNIKIKDDKKLWAVAGLSFLITYLIPDEFNLGYRILIGGILLGTIFYVQKRSYKFYQNI